MNPEERLLIVQQLLEVNEKQIANREKTLELSKQLSRDISDEKLKFEIQKLHLENLSLSNRDKELIKKL